MAEIKKVLCLGNQTVDTHTSSMNWAERLNLPLVGLLSVPEVTQAGVYHPDLAALTVDDLWYLIDDMDLTIMLDQPISSYEHVETFYSMISMCKFKKRFCPVMIEGVNDPTIWLIDFANNEDIVDYLCQQQLENSNVIVRLYSVYDLDIFKVQMEKINHVLSSNNCKWIVYRADPHETLHFEVTQVLLEYPQFVFFNPKIFYGAVQKNITTRIYQHWVNFYL
jgi:hypothetical protein